MRPDHLLPPKNPLNRHIERPVLELGQRMLHQLIPQPPLIPLIPTPQTAPLKPQPLPQKYTQIHLLLQHRPSQKSQIHNPPIPRCRIQVPLEIRRPYKIHNDIHAFAVRSLQHLGAPILRLVIEPVRRAETLAEINLLLRRRGDVDPRRAVRLAQLDAGDGHGARARMPEDGLAGTVLADEVQSLQRRDPGFGNAGRDFPREFVRLGNQHVCGDGNVFGVGAWGGAP